MYSFRVKAQEETRFDSISDMGGVGLLQMPTARFSPEGEVSLGSGRVAPYFRNALTIQPLPWAEGVLRFTTIQNRAYGPASFSGDQRYKDKGFDVKFLLAEESSAHPQIAIGFRDFAGTGLFSSEYLVLSRRYMDLDFTAGIGWGNIGSRGNIPNPLGFLSSRFKTRGADFGQGGTLSFDYFRGERASIFGGIAYRTSIPGLTLKLEYDGNNYQSEGLDNPQKTTSPFNIGLTYSYSDWLDFSLGVERGNTLMAQIALRSNINSAKGMQKLDDPPVKLKPRDLQAEIAEANRSTKDRNEPDASAAQLRVTKALEEKNFQVDGVTIEGRRATVAASQKTFRAIPRAIGRAARIVGNEVAPEIEEISYINLESGLETSRVTLLRKDLEKAERLEGSTEEIIANTRMEPSAALSKGEIHANPNRYPAFSWGWTPAMRHNYGGPDSPYLFQIYLLADASVQFTRHLSLTSALGFNLYNNFDALKQSSDSKLPHVRSDIKDYLKDGKSGVFRLQGDYLTNLAPNWFGRASAGIFEEMFGGVSGEILYKPFGKPWAIGAEANYVRQRETDEKFTFRDYKIATGHLDFYYQLPYYDTLAQLSAGRYLAGDVGYTVTLSRRFDSGATFGVWFTRTNVSAEQFGEGSFDKGFYISIPIDLLSFYSSRSSIGMAYRPLTRDGGQRLDMAKRLYPILRDSSPNQLMKDWHSLLD